jgi:hypothetical protein
MAFNGVLSDSPLVFFTDGARCIHNEIEKMFSFTKYKIILDWYHLVKRFREYYGMAFRGKEISGEYLGAIKPLLWRGDVDGAIALMANADTSIITNIQYLKKLTDYLNLVRPYIPNYAMRNCLGLRNSSDMVEKANDLVVAKRQNTTGWLGQKKARWV